MEYGFPSPVSTWEDATDHGNDSDEMDVDDRFRPQDDERLLRLSDIRSASGSQTRLTPTPTDWNRSSTSPVDRRWTSHPSRMRRASRNHHTILTEQAPPVLGERLNNSVHRSHWDRGSTRRPSGAAQRGRSRGYGNVGNVAGRMRVDHRGVTAGVEDGSQLGRDYDRPARQQPRIPTVQYVLQDYRTLVGQRENGEPIWSGDTYSKLVPAEDPPVPRGGAVR